MSRREQPGAGELVVETHGLCKRYGGGIVAVDGLDLHVRPGEVYGFPEPHGAGKTTTLRMLVGLVRPTSGSAQVLGAPPGSAEALARTGALIEGPGFYPSLSGRDDLRVVTGHAGVPEARIVGALKEVGPAGRADDRYRTYSLGGKQLAAWLLRRPDVT